MNDGNTSRQDTIEIRSSASKLFLLSVLGIVFTSLCAMILTHKIGNVPTYGADYLIMCVGVLLSSIATVMYVWELLHVKDVRLRISPDGIWMRQWGDSFLLPWNCIDNISKSRTKTQEYLILNIRAKEYAELRRGYFGYILQKLNKPFIGDGIFLSAASLNVSFNQLNVVLMGYFNSVKTKSSS